jgi:uncharacterized protein YjeT (DUF2065 family)
MESLSAAEIIARVIGPIYVIAGLGMLINPANYQSMIKGFIKCQVIGYLGGLMALAAGLLIIAVHYDWSSLFTGLIALLAWLAVLKGSVLLIMPDLVKRISAPFAESILALRIGGLGAVILGGYLAGKGFGII